MPSVFGSEVSKLERELYSLPARMGGLNVLMPTQLTTNSYNYSRRVAEVIVQAIKKEGTYETEAHVSLLQEVRREVFKKK